MELAEAPNENIPPKAAAPSVPTAVNQPKQFEDPAILSVGKRTAPPTSNHIPVPQWVPPSMERIDSSRTVTSRDDRTLRDITPSSTLEESLHHIQISEVEGDGMEGGLGVRELDAEAEVSPAQPAVKAKRPRRKRGQGRRPTVEAVPDPDVIPAKETVRSKGWRQTPLLEPNPSFQPFATLKKKGRGKQRVDENGWATEDATDVQDMPDFDFAGSLAKFDKQSVFTQIQAEDGIADEDRLVAHNRLARPKPGTAGGKNLHYTENVLDVPINGNLTVKTNTETWKSEADSDREERTSQKDTGSARHSRRAGSKLATNRRPDSRKGSSTSAQPQPTRSHSVSHKNTVY